MRKVFTNMCLGLFSNWVTR